MQKGYWVNVDGVEFSFDIGKLNFDDWVNEDPVARAIWNSDNNDGIFAKWTTYANAEPFGIAGFEKGYTRNKPNTP